MTDFDSLSPEEKRCWEFVATENDRILVGVYQGAEIAAAFKEFDHVRDVAVAMVEGYPTFQNEVERRRLERSAYWPRSTPRTTL